MKQSFLKTNTKHDITYVDINTGELIDVVSNTTTYLANSKEEFYLMYSSMILILKGSSDVKMKLFAALLERYAQGQEFSMNKHLKQRMALECNCSPRSFDTAFSYLVKHNIIVQIEKHLYVINPRHIFQGSSSKRNSTLKSIIELGCKEC